MGLLSVNCHEGKMLCDKNQYNETSLWEKIKLNFYLVICSECRGYTAKNNKLSKSIKNSNINVVSSSEKELLKQKLAEQLKAK